MSQKFHALLPGIAFLAVTIFPMSLASAQAVSLQEQLAAQYKLVKMGSDTGGYSVVEAGTLLAIQKGGILGVPYSDKTVLTTKYEGGTVHTPSGVAVQARKALFGHFSQTASEGQTTHLFAKGDKVYPTKIDVNLAKDNVTLSIVACDTCNKTDPPTYNKAQVSFQFPAGTLASASARASANRKRPNPRSSESRAREPRQDRQSGYQADLCLQGPEGHVYQR